MWLVDCAVFFWGKMYVRQNTLYADTGSVKYLSLGTCNQGRSTQLYVFILKKKILSIITFFLNQEAYGLSSCGRADSKNAFGD